MSPMLQVASLLPLLVAASPVASRSGSSLLNSSYVNPSFQQTRQIINQDAVASINALLAMPDFPQGWIGQNAYTAVADFDYLQKTTTFKSAFAKNESYYSDHPGGCYNYWHSPLVDCFNDDAGWAGMAILQGYEAYGNQTYLDWAISVHDYVTNHGFVNDTVISEGYLKGVHYANNTLNTTCDGKSMYGGVYEQNGWPYPDAESGAAMGAANTHIDSGSTATYALLSAKLCGVTGDTTYCDLAYDALNFMDEFMINPENGLVTGWIDAMTCAQPTTFVVVTTTGNYFGAHALLANLTNSAPGLATARSAALTSMNTNVWNTEKGVLVGNQTATPVVGLKAVLIRNLALIHPLMDSEMQAAIEQYVNIQYWSLVNNDSNDPEKPVLYGNDWNGPKYTSTNAMAQFEVIDVLDALAINPSSAFPSEATSGKPVITA